MTLKGTPIVILGTFRGGTSCLATAFARLGVHLGAEKHFQPIDEFNKGGYWELTEMQELNQACLMAFGMSYFGAERLPLDWEEMPGASEMVRNMRDLLGRHFAGQEHWGWKEPSTTVLLPLYKKALDADGVKPRYAIMVRHPLSIAASQRRRHAKGADEAGPSAKEPLPPDEQRMVGLWLHYTLTNLKETKGSPRQVLVYERFLQEPRKYLEQIGKNLLDWQPSDEQLEAAVGSVNPEWSHSRYSMEDLAGWPSILGRTYDLCLRAGSDPEGLQAGRIDAEIDELWNEWGIVGNMVHPSELPAGQMMVAWREAGQLAHVSQKYTPDGGWQTLTLEANAKPGDTVQIDFYQTTCQVWIRNATWRAGGKEFPASMNAGPHGILEDFGMLRLTSFGPAPLFSKAPPVPGPAELEIEFLLQFNITVLNGAVMMLRDRLDQMARGQGPQFARSAQR